MLKQGMKSRSSINLSQARNSKKAVSTIILFSMGGLLIVGVCLFMPKKETIIYGNKPLSKWFFSGRNDFWNLSTTQRASEVIKALGTNSLPFLISNLKKSGNSALYFKIYG